MADTTEVLAPLTSGELRRVDAYWRACNYLSGGMIYLRANPLLREPLKPEHIKNRLLGHWGSDPGQSLEWVGLATRRRRVPFMRAASLAIPSRMLTEPHSTILILSSPSQLATARRK